MSEGTENKLNSSDSLVLLNKNKAIDVKTIVFLVVSFALFLTFAFPFLTNDPVESNYQTNVFFFQGQDFLADFFNVCVYSQERDPYFNLVNDAAEKAYFPLSYLICFFAAKFMGYPVEYPNLSKQALIWGVLFISFFVASVAVAVFSSVRGSIAKKALITIAVMVSGPTLFTIERGNLILIAITGMIIFTSTYTSEDKMLRHLGYIALAIAAALKGYPAILGLLLLYRKKWKDAVCLALYGLFFSFAPFLLLRRGAVNILKWYENLQSNTLKYEFAYGDKIGFRFFLVNNQDLVIEEMMQARSVINPIVICISILAIIGACFVKKEWIRYLMLLSVILIIPANNGYYTVMYMIPLIVLLLNEEKNDPVIIATLVITSVMMMPYKLPAGLIFNYPDSSVCLTNIIACFFFAVSTVYCIVSGTAGTIRFIRDRSRKEVSQKI